MDVRTGVAVVLAIGVVLYMIVQLFTRPKVDTDATVISSSYDYVIVGGGSAGAVLANRLSEDADVSVLLLEAGGAEVSKREVAIPAASAMLQNSAVDWQYRTAPQKHCYGACHGRVGWWPRGKVLGGSSAINYMQYVRGHAEDYDLWKAKGWAWKDVLPYFLKSEQCLVPGLRDDAAAHSTTGPMAVSHPPAAHPLSHVFVSACDEAGIKAVADYNNAQGDNHGAALSQTTTRAGRREDTASAFLRPIMHLRPNLHVVTRAHVLRVVFADAEAEAKADANSKDSKDSKESKAAKEPRASGVVFRRGTNPKTAPDTVVHATREVVLCGGAINSPHLLMLSGIGPRAQLQKQQIDVVKDLPGVGANLHDHLLLPLPFESRTATYSERDANLPNLFRYLFQGRGPFTSTGLECTAFFNTGVRPDLKAPDMQIHFLAAKVGDKEANNTNVDRERVKNPACHYSMTFLCVGLHPKSIGRLEIASPDPFAQPLIDPNHFENADDVKAFTIGVRKVQEIATKTKAFAPHIIRSLTPAGQALPADVKAACGEADSDAEWDWRIRQTALTCYHPVGTCRLTGAADLKADPTAVVDAQLRVFGVRGLRVADCSVMPAVPSGNTNAPAIMIGEKCADLIKATRKAQAKAKAVSAETAAK